MRKEALYVLIVIDVEEEGVLSDFYPRFPSIENVAFLPELAFLTTECNIPLTLMCSHAAFTQTLSCRVLERMRSAWGAEIGAHLHYWSTPPHSDIEKKQTYMPTYTAAKDVPRHIMHQKFRELFAAAEQFCGHPVDIFRMGHWDMAQGLWNILAEYGVRIDSSVRPWHSPKNWRNHFCAPTQPYACHVGDTRIIEVPVTSVPLIHSRTVQNTLHAAPSALINAWHRAMVMTPNPLSHSLPSMQTAARLLLARGERVLCLTWPSSALMPGATPSLPTRKSVDAMLLRVRRFLQWLHTQAPVYGVTLSGLVDVMDATGLIPTLTQADYISIGDWHPLPQ